MLSIVKKTRSAASKAAEGTRRAVDELRDLRLRLLDQRADVLGRPLPLEAAQEAARAAVQARVDKVLAEVAGRPSLRRPGDGQRPFLTLHDADVLDLAFMAAAPAISEALCDAIAQAYDREREPISAEMRAREVARLDDELLSVELAEESVIRTIEREGIEIARRPDMDPRVLLAADEELK